MNHMLLKEVKTWNKLPPKSPHYLGTIVEDLSVKNDAHLELNMLRSTLGNKYLLANQDILKEKSQNLDQSAKVSPKLGAKISSDRHQNEESNFNPDNSGNLRSSSNKDDPNYNSNVKSSKISLPKIMHILDDVLIKKITRLFLYQRCISAPNCSWRWYCMWSGLHEILKDHVVLQYMAHDYISLQSSTKPTIQQWGFSYFLVASY